MLPRFFLSGVSGLNDKEAQERKQELKKIRGLEADLAQMKENLSASDRQQQTAEAKQDKHAKDLSSTGSKGALAINEKKCLNTMMVVLEGKLVAA